MAMALGKVVVDLETRMDDTTRVLVAATRMHDAIYYLSATEVEQLPDAVRRAWGDLQRSIKAIGVL